MAASHLSATPRTFRGSASRHRRSARAVLRLFVSIRADVSSDSGEAHWPSGARFVVIVGSSAMLWVSLLKLIF